VIYFHNALLQKSLRQFGPAQIDFVFSKKVSLSVQFSADFLPDITKKPFFMAFCEVSAIGILPS
jgi:hypothetical protein